MNKKYFAFATIFLIITALASQKTIKESFIAQPKQKKESRSKIQEDIAELLMQATQQNPQLIEREARFEQRLLRYGSQLLTQEKNSFIATADLKELQEFRNALQELIDAQENHSKLLIQLETKFNNITSSCKK